jgi:predicted 3-demethylubiquinone-9 3-methyltransferase (glyoxalase superfamily)
MMNKRKNYVQKITPFLWFDGQAEDAVKFYTSLFKNSKIGRILRNAEGPAEKTGRPVGSVLTIEFEIEGQKLIALNGGPLFKFNESVSFVVNCETQEEVDYFWGKLTADGGEESQIRSFVANHPNCLDRHVTRQGSRKIGTSHERDASNAEDRNSKIEGCLRREMILFGSHGANQSKTANH